MDARYAPLLESRLFFGIPPQWIEERVLPLCTEREYSSGAQLIAQHDAVREIGIILSGRVQILQLFPDGKSSLMRVLSPGELIGLDLAYTRTGVSPYHAIASEASKVLYMPRNLPGCCGSFRTTTSKSTTALPSFPSADCGNGS